MYKKNKQTQQQRPMHMHDILITYAYACNTALTTN